MAGEEDPGRRGERRPKDLRERKFSVLEEVRKKKPLGWNKTPRKTGPTAGYVGSTDASGPTAWMAGPTGDD